MYTHHVLLHLFYNANEQDKLILYDELGFLFSIHTNTDGTQVKSRHCKEAYQLCVLNVNYLAKIAHYIY